MAIRRLVGGQGSAPEDAASHVDGAAFDDVGAFGDYSANPVAYIARQVIGMERRSGSVSEPTMALTMAE